MTSLAVSELALDELAEDAEVAALASEVAALEADVAAETLLPRITST